MFSRYHANAQYQPGYHKRGCAPSQRPLLIMLLCLLLPLMTGCAQTAQEKAGQGASNVAKQTDKRPLTYVAIGASDAFGIGTYDPYNENWATDLLYMLNASRYHLINLGIPDITIHDALGLELPVALDAHPDLVTIWLGVNDIAANVPASSYARDLDTLLSRLQAGSPLARIAIANIPDLTLLQHFSGYNQRILRQQIQAYNAAIARNVQHHHIIPVDLSRQNYDLKTHPEYVSRDGLHPTGDGYHQLALLFYTALRNTLR
jgi:lysophospholipase L1-like esterase